MYCAARAAETGLSAAVAEHGKSLGRKLGITGKGRCNITNNCDPETVLKNVPRNPRFLYSALSKCSPADVMEYFEGLGVPLKTERGQRVFPVSDKAGDVVNALENQLRRLNVEIIRGNCTRLVIEDGRCAGALISGREVRALGRLGVRPRAAGGAYRHGALAVAYPDGDRGALGKPRGRS